MTTLPRYFEDFEVGKVIDCGGGTITQKENMSVPKEFDPQPIHIDESYAAQHHFGEIIGSGLHVLGICMRHAVDTFLRDAATLGSPGTENIKLCLELHDEKDGLLAEWISYGIFKRREVLEEKRHA